MHYGMFSQNHGPQQDSINIELSSGGEWVKGVNHSCQWQMFSFLQCRTAASNTPTHMCMYVVMLCIQIKQKPSLLWTILQIKQFILSNIIYLPLLLAQNSAFNSKFLISISDQKSSTAPTHLLCSPPSPFLFKCFLYFSLCCSFSLSLSVCLSCELLNLQYLSRDTLPFSLILSFCSLLTLLSFC